MHIKFLPHGRGSGKDAIDYLLSDRDHQGKERESVTVLRGNPKLVAEVVDSLSFKNRYSSGVIAWSPTDCPSKDEIEDVLNDVERLAFAGLELDRHCWAAIQHNDHDGSVHVHFIAARVDLRTGKSLNISPPGWQGDFDPLRDYHNYAHGWARPDDPQRARLYQPGHQSFLKQGNPKEAITNYLFECIAAGVVKDRADIKAKLSEVGEITREGADYISIKPTGFSKAVRLKGGIYSAEFNTRTAASTDQEITRGSREDNDYSRERAREAKERLEQAVAKRAGYNLGRYGKNSISNRRETPRNREAEQTGSEIGRQTVADFDSADVCCDLRECGGRQTLAGVSDEADSGAESRRSKTDSRTAPFERREKSSNQGDQWNENPEVKATRVGKDPGDDQWIGDVSGFPEGSRKTRTILEYRGSMGSEAKIEVKNDRDCNYAYESTGEFAKRLQQGRRNIVSITGRLLDCGRRIKQTSEQLRARIGKIHESNRHLIGCLVRKAEQVIGPKQSMKHDTEPRLGRGGMGRGR